MTNERCDGNSGLLTLETLHNHWPKFLAALRPRNLALEAVMHSCKIVAVKEDVISLQFIHDLLRRYVERPHNKYVLEDVLNTLIGQQCHVQCIPVHQERNAMRSRRYHTRSNDLRRMPYDEYLQTSEWQATRKKALKRAEFRCQVCNAKDTILHVHHRTYENRGHERACDLIVLCSDCHELFHQNGRLT